MDDSVYQMVEDMDLAERFDALEQLVGIPVRSGMRKSAAVEPMEGLTARLSALTTAISDRAGVARWDEADRLIVRVLLSDLALVAGHLRALVSATRVRLVSAREDLKSCRNMIE